MSGGVTFRHAEPVMGTVVSFDVRPRGVPATQTRRAISQACEVLHQADHIFSLYRHDSPVSRLRRGEVTLAACPPEVQAVLDLCAEAREQSEGWFDPWALEGGVDPTGLVKGWAAREAAAVLQAAGIQAGMVNAAGDIVTFGRPASTRPWTIGVRHPHQADRLLCAVTGTTAVATSGSYERGEHVRDVHHGRAAGAALAVTVCGADLAFADAFATGLMAAGEGGFHALRKHGYEALIVRPDGSTVHTPGFPFAS